MSLSPLLLSRSQQLMGEVEQWVEANGCNDFKPVALKICNKIPGIAPNGTMAQLCAGLVDGACATVAKYIGQVVAVGFVLKMFVLMIVFVCLWSRDRVCTDDCVCNDDRVCNACNRVSRPPTSCAPSLNCARPVLAPWSRRPRTRWPRSLPNVSASSRARSTVARAIAAWMATAATAWTTAAMSAMARAAAVFTASVTKKTVDLSLFFTLSFLFSVSATNHFSALISMPLVFAHNTTVKLN
jgi:hypothetical protein